MINLSTPCLLFFRKSGKSRKSENTLISIDLDFLGFSKGHNIENELIFLGKIY